jgi:hypothetical protein
VRLDPGGRETMSRGNRVGALELIGMEDPEVIECCTLAARNLEDAEERGLTPASDERTVLIIRSKGVENLNSEQVRVEPKLDDAALPAPPEITA